MMTIKSPAASIMLPTTIGLTATAGNEARTWEDVRGISSIAKQRNME